MTHGKPWAGFAALACLVGLAAGVVADDGEATLKPLTTAEAEVPAGVPVTLGWVLTDEEGRPAFHQDAKVTVTHEGDTLLATTPASGHDYDGVDPYQIAFPEPGNYTVEARVHDDGEVRQLTYTGTVGPAPEDEVDLSLDAPDTVREGERVELGVDVRGPDGRPVEDVEVTLRVQRTEDRFEVLKTRLAGEDPSLGYAFARPGGFQLVAVAAPVPGGDADDLGAASARQPIEVEPAPAPGPVGVGDERPLRNALETGEGSEGDRRLFATFDPYTSVGPHGRLRLGLLTLNATTHAPAPDVSYRVSILDPDGRQVLHTDDLHAADGFEYVTLSRPDPGTYTARIDAKAEGWRDHAVAEFTVQPPVVATNAGPLFATPNASTSLEVGEPAAFPIHVEDAAGVPLLHGEVDVRWLDGEGIPQVAGKLHVHENGTFPITLAANQPGDRRLELLPQSLQPTPTPYTYGEHPGQPPVFDVDVRGPTDVVEEELAPAEADTGQQTPGPASLAAVLVLAVVARLARDRAT